MKAIMVGLASFAVVFAATIALLGPPDDPEVLERLAVEQEADRLAALGARPTWLEGRAWLVDFGDADPCWVVVARADADGFRQGFSCEGDRRFAASLSARGARGVGNFSRDLEGLGDDEAVAFFQWPLRDGAKWATTWYGQDVEVHARYASRLDGPSGKEPGFKLEMVDDNDETILRYDYVPSLGWWSTFATESGFAMQVLDHVDDWRGTTTVAYSEPRFTWTFRALNSFPFFPVFKVEPEDNALVFAMFASGTGYSKTELRDPDNQLRYQDETIFRNEAQSRWAFIDDAQDGVWSLGGPHAVVGSIDIIIYGVNFDRVSL